ncbi:MAG: hypothetical protein NC453_17125 [Muribaculum sp.]|nr:hypothetical protein [Muribaculum sp.]
MTENEQLTNPEKLQRLGDMIDWMLFNNIVESRRELAKRMHYQESTLSLVVNGKQPMSPKFLKALSLIDPRLNVDWIDKGEGEMIVEVDEDNGKPTKDEVEMFLRQQDSLQQAQDQLSLAFQLGNVDVILAQQAIVQKESETLDMLAISLKLSKERMMAIFGNNNRDNYFDSNNSGNKGSFNGRQKAKRYVRKKPGEKK